MPDNPYLPYPVRIEQITTETEDRNLKTFKLVFLNKEDEEQFSYIPGQFCELSIAGKGEIPIGVASSPTEQGFLLFTQAYSPPTTSQQSHIIYIFYYIF